MTTAPVFTQYPDYFGLQNTTIAPAGSVVTYTSGGWALSAGHQGTTVVIGGPTTTSVTIETTNNGVLDCAVGNFNVEAQQTASIAANQTISIESNGLLSLNTLGSTGNISIGGQTTGLTNVFGHTTTVAGAVVVVEGYGATQTGSIFIGRNTAAGPNQDALIQLDAAAINVKSTAIGLGDAAGTSTYGVVTWPGSALPAPAAGGASIGTDLLLLCVSTGANPAYGAKGTMFLSTTSS